MLTRKKAAEEALSLSATAEESLKKARELYAKAGAETTDLDRQKKLYQQAEEWLKNAERLASAAQTLAS